MASDPARAAAEYLAQFRTDLEAFVSREAVEACVTWGCYERAPESAISYIAFLDPSGGSGTDSMALAIGHYDHNERKVIVTVCAKANRRSVPRSPPANLPH